MSLHEYLVSQEIDRTDPPFYSCIMAAMRLADTNNELKLRTLFPGVWRELQARYNAPGGKLPEDDL